MKFAGFVRQHVQRISLGLLILFTLLLHTAGLIELGWMHRFETYSYDLRLQATMPGGVDRRIVIVDIDDKSLNEQGQWPWPRNKLALMVDQLFDRYKINVLGFDVLFAEPDHSSGIRTLEELARGELQDDSRYVQALDKLRPQLQYDQLFANSLKNRNVVLGYYFRHDHQAGKSTGQVGQLPPPVLPAGSFAPEAVGADVASGYSANLPVLQQAAVSGGFINASPLVDADGVFRRIPLLQMHGAALYETLSLAVARLALKQPQLRLHYDYGQIDLQWLDAILLGDRRVPIDANVAALAPFRGPQGSFVYVSASDVLSGTANADALAGAIVLVGTTAPGLKDLRSTPVEKVYAGVEMHANMVAGILDSSVKERPAYFLALELLGLVLLGGLLILALPALSPIHAAVLTGATMAFLVGTNLYYWQVQSLVLPLASGLVLVSALFVLNMSWGFFVDSRAKRALARLFGQYVPPELVDEMAQDPSAYSLAGENRQMTVLFSDVRGFTTISEGLTPEQLTQLMNEYLEWHLLCLPRVTVALDLSSSVGARDLQPRVGLGSSFSHSRLDTARPIAHPALGDQCEQSPTVIRGRQTARDPLRPQLHRVLEAQATRVHAGVAGGLRHEQADHVVGQQMDPQLFLVHLRRLAAQHIHARGGLEVAQVELDVPAPRVQRPRSSLLVCRWSSSVVTSTLWSTRTSRTVNSLGKAAYCSGVIHSGRAAGLGQCTM
jgi:adenylate cyclase